MKKNKPKKKKTTKKRATKPSPKFSKKQLDSFLSSICDAAGMKTGSRDPRSRGEKVGGLTCQAGCRRAEWRAHLDIPQGLICVSVAWAAHRKKGPKHRDVTLAVTTLDEKGKAVCSEQIYCDTEVRWLMETLWHAPIW